MQIGGHIVVNGLYKRGGLGGNAAAHRRHYLVEPTDAVGSGRLDAIARVFDHRAVGRGKQLDATGGHEAGERVQTGQVVVHAPVGPAHHGGTLGEEHVPGNHEIGLGHVEGRRIAGMPRQRDRLQGKPHVGHLHRTGRKRAGSQPEHRRAPALGAYRSAAGVVGMIVGQKHRRNCQAAGRKRLLDALDAGRAIGARIHHNAALLGRMRQDPGVRAAVGKGRRIGMAHALGPRPHHGTVLGRMGARKGHLRPPPPCSRGPLPRPGAPPGTDARGRRREAPMPRPPSGPAPATSGSR